MGRRSGFLPIFARFLPREFRERVFEPAWADVLLDEQRPGAHRRGAVLSRFVLVLECLRLGLPQLVWHRGRLTRLARGAAVAVVVVAVALVVLLRAAYPAHAVGP